VTTIQKFLSPLIFLALVPLLAGSGCESRDHDNPLDPDNPSTGGVPDNLTLIAGDGLIDLRWSDYGYRDLREQKIRRSMNGGSETVIAAGLDADILSYRDTALVNGEVYTYRLEWAFEGSGERVLLDTQRARPGPAIVWSIEASAGGLLRLTPDGQQAVQWVGPGRTILDLTVDPETGRVWAADFDRGQILAADPRTGTSEIWDQSGVNTLSYDAGMRVLWAGAYYEQSVAALTPSGGEILAIPGLGHIEDVDARPFFGAFYAAREGTVGAISLAGLVTEIAQAVWPVAVQWDSLSAGVWILDRQAKRVLFAPLSGAPPDTIISGLSDPIDLGLDRSGRCWVADRGGRVWRCLREGGADLVLELPFAPTGVTVDGTSGEVWVASSAAPALRIYDDAGNEQFRLAGAYGTKKIEGAWSPAADPRSPGPPAGRPRPAGGETHQRRDYVTQTD
jgi:hypothetical protein